MLTFKSSVTLGRHLASLSPCCPRCPVGLIMVHRGSCEGYSRQKALGTAPGMAGMLSKCTRDHTRTIITYIIHDILLSRYTIMTSTMINCHDRRTFVLLTSILTGAWSMLGAQQLCAE